VLENLLAQPLVLLVAGVQDGAAPGLPVLLDPPDLVVELILDAELPPDQLTSGIQPTALI
jgi:hypothetical protein